MLCCAHVHIYTAVWGRENILAPRISTTKGDCPETALRINAIASRLHCDCRTHTLLTATDGDCATNVLNSSKHSRPIAVLSRQNTNRGDSRRLQHDSCTTVYECSTICRDLISRSESRWIAVVSREGVTGALAKKKTRARYKHLFFFNFKRYLKYLSSDFNV